MGYNSRLTGFIDIDPPLTFSEIREMRRESAQTSGRGLFYFDIKEDDVETNEGVLAKQTCPRISVANGSELRAYDAEAELREMVRWAAAEGRRFIGTILVLGEENGDIWRLRVSDDGKVIKETAEITWPDGAKVQL